MSILKPRTPIKNMEIYCKLGRLCIPMILQGIISFSFGIIDTLMLGKLGEDAISASAIANQPVSIFLTAVMGLGSGMAVLISQYWGRNETERIKDVTAFAFRIYVWLAGAGTLLCLLFPNVIVGFFTPDQVVRDLAGQYLRIVAFAMPAVGLSNVISAVLRGIETVHITFTASLISFVVNVALNQLFIFGGMGVPPMGVAGAAAATLCARFVGLLIIGGYFLLRDKKLVFKLTDLKRRTGAVGRAFSQVGLPVMLNDLLWSVASSVQMGILSNLSIGVVTANSICNIVSQVVFIFVYSTADATTVIIGGLVGRGGMDRLKRTTRVLQRLFILMGVSGCVIMMLIRKAILLPFNIDPATRQITLEFITIAALLMICMAYTAPAMMGILRGGGDTRFTFLVDLGLVWLVAIPAGLIGGYILSLPFWAVYLLLKLDEPIKAIVISLRINGWRWVRNVTQMNHKSSSRKL